MKTILTIFVTLSFGFSFGQTTLIPDPVFEQRLINLGLDAGTPDGSVPTANINTVTSLDVSNDTIKDLTGIEDFTALENLNCSQNRLDTLDVSQNTALTDLDFSGQWYNFCSNTGSGISVVWPKEKPKLSVTKIVSIVFIAYHFN